MSEWKSFRFVRACARSGCQVEFELKSGEGLFSFPFCPAEFSLFPCVAERFPFFLCEIEVRSKDNRSEFEMKSKLIEVNPKHSPDLFLVNCFLIRTSN